MKHTQRIHKFRFNFWVKDSMYETYYLRIWELHGFSMLACSCMINAIFLYLHRSYVVLSFYAFLRYFLSMHYISTFIICILSFIVHFFVMCDQSYDTMCMLSICCMAFEVWRTFTVHGLGLWHSSRCTVCTFGILCISWLVQSYGIQGLLFVSN